MSVDEPTPRRLDEILAGEPATTAAERELLSLAADLRADLPTPSTELRERVRALGEPVGARGIRRPRRPGWPSLAPALGALLVVLVAGGIVLRDRTATNDIAQTTPTADVTARGGPTADPSALQSDQGLRGGSATESAQSAPAATVPTWTLRPGTRDTAIDEIRSLVDGAAGTLTVTSIGAAARQLTIDLPIASAPETFQRIVDVVAAQRQPETQFSVTPPPAGSTQLIIRLSEADG